MMEGGPVNMKLLDKIKNGLININYKGKSGLFYVDIYRNPKQSDVENYIKKLEE